MKIPTPLEQQQFPTMLPKHSRQCSAQLVSALLIASCSLVIGCTDPVASRMDSIEEQISGPVYASPGQDLQAALDLAASATDDRRLILRPGKYTSDRPKFCLLAITACHNGVVIEGTGETILSGKSADHEAATILSHVVYCGHGLTSETQIRNLTISGGGESITKVGVPRERYEGLAGRLQQGVFFHMDGGAVKVFGESYPTFEQVHFENNETKLCGGAVSIEQQGLRQHPVTIRNCVFKNNRCPATGSAVDVLQGSSVEIHNCLFVENIGNYGMDLIRLEFGLSYNETHGSGALTVFPASTAVVTGCTFVRNWNAVDDRGEKSSYRNCIFAANDSSDGSRPGHPYEVNIDSLAAVKDCVFSSAHPDLKGSVSLTHNTFLDAPIKFSSDNVPSEPNLGSFGYRPPKQ